MRPHDVRWMVPVVLVAVLAGCSGTQPQAKPPVDQAAIGAAIDSVETAWTGACAARDTTLLVGLYADDAHVFPANGPRAESKEAIRQAWVGFLSTPGLDLKLSPNAKVISEAGDLVIDLGTYEMNAKDAKGKPTHDVGKYVTAFKKVNGEWKIVVDTWNTDTPMPGQGH
jgi:uncharacterized protein (TIGR02246 family)